MQELGYERKAVIDALHYRNFTPVYIEASPDVDETDGRKRMEKLVKSADALILLYGLSVGKPAKVLDNMTPVEFEFHLFQQSHTNAPIFLLQKGIDGVSYVHEKFAQHFSKYPKAQNIDDCTKRKNVWHFKFSETNQLIDIIIKGCIEKELRKYERESDLKSEDRTFLVRCKSPDFIGFLERISYTLSHIHLVNIDYISFARRFGLATVYLSCTKTYRKNETNSVKEDRELIRESIKKTLCVDIQKAQDEGRLLNVTGKDAKELCGEVEVTVDFSDEQAPDYSIYIEVRTIDAPGQLHAIARVIRDMSYSIDEILLKPSEQEHLRQLIISAWISKGIRTGKTGEKDLDIATPELELIRLESRLRDIVGVKTFSTRLVRNDPRDH